MTTIILTDTAGNRSKLDVTHITHLCGYNDGFSIRDGLRGQVMLEKFSHYDDITDIHALADYLAAAGRPLGIVPIRRYKRTSVDTCDYISPADVMVLETTEASHGHHGVRIILRGGSEVTTHLTPAETAALTACIMTAKPQMLALSPDTATISRHPAHLALYLDPASITQILCDGIQVRLGYQGINAIPACHPPRTQDTDATPAERQAKVNALARKIHAATTGLMVVPECVQFTALRPGDLEKCTAFDEVSPVTGAPLFMIYAAQKSLPVVRPYPDGLHLLFATAQARDTALRSLTAATAATPHSPKP